MKNSNIWLKKKGNTFIPIKVNEMANLHLLKALTLQIKNYDNLAKDHDALMRRKSELEKLMEKSALSGIAMQEELKENRGIIYKFGGNTNKLHKETMDLFFSTEAEDIINNDNNTKPLLQQFSKPILSK